MGANRRKTKRHDPRMDRLRHVIKYEGHELQDCILLERFPWAKKEIAEVRRELGIPSPVDVYLTSEDMRGAKIPYRYEHRPLVGNHRCEVGSDAHARHIREAQERASEYE